jgi:hypothetical protein
MSERPWAGFVEYDDAKLAAQRMLDQISLGLRLYLDDSALGQVAEQPCIVTDGEVEMVELSAVYMLAAVRVGEAEYLDRAGVYAIPPADAELMIRLGRARSATDDEIDAHNRGCEEWEQSSVERGVIRGCGSGSSETWTATGLATP